MIEVTGLSSVTDTESLRVSGLGNAKLLVVNCLREQFTEISESDQIRDLKSQKRELRVERGARIAELEILEEFEEKIRTQMRADRPLKREGTAEDVAEAALYFATDRSRYVTGTVLPVDGGTVAGKVISRSK